MPAMEIDTQIGILIGMFAILIAFLAWRATRRNGGPVTQANLTQAVAVLSQQLAAATKRIEAQDVIIVTLQARVSELEALITLAGAANKAKLLTTPVLLALGADHGIELEVDLAAWRYVKRVSNLDYTVLRRATMLSIESVLNTWRENGLPIRHMQLSGHMGPDGIELADGMVTAAKLSGLLDGVEVLLLAGCEASMIGEFLRVVPAVLSVREPLSDVDSARLTRVFWALIGNSVPPGAAFVETKARLPSRLAEMLELHT